MGGFCYVGCVMIVDLDVFFVPQLLLVFISFCEWYNMYS